MLQKTWPRLLNITSTQEGITIKNDERLGDVCGEKEVLHLHVSFLNFLHQTWQGFQGGIPDHDDKEDVNYFSSTNLSCMAPVKWGQLSTEALAAQTPTVFVLSTIWGATYSHDLKKSQDVFFITDSRYLQSLVKGSSLLNPWYFVKLFSTFRVLVTHSDWPKSSFPGPLLVFILHRKSHPIHLPLSLAFCYGPHCVPSPL